MDRSLWLLLRLRAWAFLRRWGRNLRTPKGALLAVAGSCVFLPMIILFFFAPRIMIASQREAIRQFGPLALLGYCVLNLLLSSGDRAIYYSSAEVNLLFCGPYRPRQLLIYKVVGGVAAALLTAFAMTFAFAHHATIFLAAFAGIFFALELIYLFSLAVGLAIATLGEIASNRGRLLVLSMTALLASASLWSVGQDVWALPRWEVVSRALNSPAMAIVLTPFRPFVMTFTAERVWPELVVCSALAFLVDFTLLVLVVALNARFLEAAAAASVRVHARLQRVRQGDTWAGHPQTRFRVPMFPWWGGVGPNFWRQLTTVARRPQQLLALLFMFSVPVFMIVLEFVPIQDQGVGPALPMLGMMAFIAQSTLGYDFRLDQGRIETLKTLPVRSTFLVLSQLLTPVLVLSLVEWLTLGVIALIDAPDRGLLSAVAALVVPTNLLLVAIENLYFLWYPYRNTAVNSFDIQAMGRQLLLMMAKVASMSMAGALAAGAGALVYLYGSQGWFSTIAVAAVVLSACGLALVPPIALAFERFDVTRHKPE